MTFKQLLVLIPLISFITGCGTETPAAKHLVSKQAQEVTPSELSPSLTKVITLIEAVEQAYPDDDWKTIAIRLRKTHYNS